MPDERWESATMHTGSLCQLLTILYQLLLVERTILIIMQQLPMLHNSIKKNWTLQQLNWQLCSAGDINEYDGLTELFVKLTEADLELFSDPYIKHGYKLSVGMK